MSTIVVLSIVVGLAWATVPIVHTRVNALLTPQTDVSSSIRMVIWRRAVREWQTSPVFGVGFLKFPHLYAPNAIVPGHSKDLNHAHSNYLQFLSTTGVVGLAAYAWLLLWALIWSRRLFMIGRIGNVPVLAGYGNGLFAMTASLAIAGIFEYNFGTAQVRLAQWFLLGLLTFARPPVAAPPPPKTDAVSSVAA
jgi:hypothetical protein